MKVGNRKQGTMCVIHSVPLLIHFKNQARKIFSDIYSLAFKKQGNDIVSRTVPKLQQRKNIFQPVDGIDNDQYLVVD